MKTVIVLGLRSGSSLTAGILTDLGIYMGENFRAPDEGNARGYYEEGDILNVIERELLNGGRFEQTQAITHAELSILGSLKEAIDKHKREPIWGFKAPGVAFVIRAVELFVENPHYIVCSRDKSEMAKSLESKLATHHVPRGFNAMNWITTYTHIRSEELRNKKVLDINYEDMLNDPEKEVNRIVKFLGIDVPETLIKRAVRRVDPSLKHHMSSKPVFKGFQSYVEE